MFKLDRNIAYLIGALVGDGYISNSRKSKSDKSKDYRISMELSDICYLEKVLFPLVCSLVLTKSVPRRRKRKGKKESSYFLLRNKQLYLFLTSKMGMLAGKKEGLVIPKKIVDSNSIIKREFISGLFDTDGGFRGGSLGFTMKSKILRDEVIEIISSEDIKVSPDNWISGYNGLKYYGLRISKNDIVNFLNRFPLRNPEKLMKINRRFFNSCGSAGAVKRARLRILEIKQFEKPRGLVPTKVQILTPTLHQNV